MIEFVNLTPHDIVLNDGRVFRASGTVARVSSTHTHRSMKTVCVVCPSVKWRTFPNRRTARCSSCPVWLPQLRLIVPTWYLLQRDIGMRSATTKDRSYLFPVSLPLQHGDVVGVPVS